jgi:2,4-dienoyl-CoA reductase-like NADH-dependent reductase (Old Yellow Enzyme family)/thioredoxin reductase
MKYPNVFSPFVVNGMTVKNRVTMTPMGTNFAGIDGAMNADHIKYYEQRAKGGTGFIIVESACVEFPRGTGGTTQIRLDHDKFIPSFSQLVNRVHAYDTRIALQINHAGASANPERIGQSAVSASNIPSKTGFAIPRELTKAEIVDIAVKFGKAAKRAKMAGFDAVEIHAAHSYLINQFLSPIYNKRTDEFGGSYENRARFARMVIDHVREQVGPGFPIIVRVNGEDFLEGGNTLEDALKIVEYLNDEVDVFDVSAGTNDSLFYQMDQMNFPDGWRAYMAEAVKKRFNKPVIITGNIRDPKVAEDIVASGKADLIGMGRGLLAEPDWVNKVANHQEDLLRKCICCNIGCIDNRNALNIPIKCTVNPDLIHGEEYKENKIKRPVNVVVIGGGTTGLEAACTAAETGCTTFLLEQKSYLGGLAKDISKLPDKIRIGDFPQYLFNRSEKLNNLFILTNTKAAIETIEKFKPDVIVNATGSKPLLPPIKGLLENVDKENGKVHSILSLLNNIDKFGDCEGKEVVIIGGGAVGLDVAEYFAKRNAKVKMVEMLPVVGRDLDSVTKQGMLAELKKHDVEIHTKATLQEVFADHFKVNDHGGEKNVPFDYGFVCLGMRPEICGLNDIQEHFKEKNVEVVNIGDSKQARKIINGTEEGRNIMVTLKKIGAF